MANVTTTARIYAASASTPTIYNLSMPTANTEYSQALSNNTRKLLIRMRTAAKARIAFVSGDTVTNYVTLNSGAVFFEENLQLTGVTIYLQSELSSQVAEILEWT